MTPQDIADLERFPSKKFEKGTFIIKQGEPIGNVYFLIGGSCKRITTCSSGNEITYELHKPSTTIASFLGALALFRPDQSYQISQVALENCTCIVMSKQDFYAYLEQHPHIYEEFLRYAMTGFSLLEKYFKFKQDKNTPGQICTTLYYKALPNESCLCSADKLTNSELARLSGANRSTVTRVMRELKRQGIAENTEDGIEILNADKLRALVYDEEKLEYLNL